jgi:DNA-binding NarL/FixJ family response regulator
MSTTDSDALLGILRTLLAAVDLHVGAVYSNPANHRSLSSIAQAAREAADMVPAREVTPAQMRTLAHVARTGDTLGRTAATLGITEQTVKNHLSSAYRTLSAGNLVGAFIALGWLNVPEEEPIADD